MGNIVVLLINFSMGETREGDEEVIVVAIQEQSFHEAGTPLSFFQNLENVLPSLWHLILPRQIRRYRRSKHVSIIWESMSIDPSLNEGEDVIYLLETLESARPRWRRQDLERNIIVRSVNPSRKVRALLSDKEASYLEKWRTTV